MGGRVPARPSGLLGLVFGLIAREGRRLPLRGPRGLKQQRFELPHASLEFLDPPLQQHTTRTRHDLSRRLHHQGKLSASSRQQIEAQCSKTVNGY